MLVYSLGVAIDAPPVVPITCPAPARALAQGVRCGFVRVPLDRSGGQPGTVRIYFERYPPADRSRPPASTVLSIEGGPGYPTAADRVFRGRMWQPISKRRALLLIDLRGTGRSGPLACRALARTTLDYVVRAGACARQLGPKRDFYGTGDAVEDLETVLLAVGAGKVDLYGDSYGTYAAQAFALRHPERLRSLTLDAAYPLPGTDPAYADLVAAFRRGLRLVCQRRPGCPAAQTREDAVALLQRTARRLSARPVRGFGLDGDGNLRPVTLDDDALAQIAGSSYYSYAVWKDILAAAVALDRGDAVPMLRLGAEHLSFDAGEAVPADFSDPLYLAVTCHDYPQLWSPDTPIAKRAEEVAARLGGYPLGTFTPFTAESWTSYPYEGPLACLRWPSPTGGQSPEPPDAEYPRVPTLVLNGDLDTITASSGAKVVASRFPRSWFVELQNSVHVTALGDRDDCASVIYQRFVKQLSPGDTSCRRAVPEIRLVTRFPGALAEVDAGRPEAGNQASARHRKLAVAAAQTASDVISRWWVNYSGESRGLRGGTWTYEGDDVTTFTLDRVVFVSGVRVSGTVEWASDGSVHADVEVDAPRGERAELELSWSGSPLARATMRGWSGGERLVASMLAP